MTDKQNIKNLTMEELEKVLVHNGFSKYRASQVYDWIYKDVEKFNYMLNIPKDLINYLNNNFYIFRANIIKKQISTDGTIKYLLELEDQNTIECVLMKYKYGYSICISTQVGCRMGCKFCASTIHGLERNLNLGEMIEEIMVVVRDTREKISNIVLMGIGEPFDNYDEIIRFLKTVNHKSSFNIGMRHITISTSGIVPKIYKFADEDLQCNLAISLHSAKNVIRSKLMPINNKYNIEELIKACKYYINKTNRRISFEYILIQGINDSKDDAKVLCTLIRDMLCYVNLIPLNKTLNKNMKKPKDTGIDEFKEVLMKNGIHTTVRRELGQDIDGACGQLRTRDR